MAYATITKRTIRGFLLIFMAICLVGVVATVVQAATASQFSKKLTNPSDVEAGGVVGKVDLHLKNVKGIAVVDTNKMAAYYSKSLATSVDAEGNEVLKTKSSMKLKISKGRDAGHCKIPADADGNIEVWVAKKRVFSQPTTKTCSKFLGATIAFPNDISFDSDDKSGFFKAEIDVKFTGGSMTPAKLGGSPDGYALNYTMELVDSYGDKSMLALRGGTTSKEFGFRSSYRTNPPANRQVKAGVVFGFPCDVNPSTLFEKERSVKLYDPDPEFGMTYMWIEKNSNPGSMSSQPVSYDDYDGTLSKNIKLDSWDSTNKRWTVEPGNGTTAILGLKARASSIDVKSEYRLMVLNTGKNENGSNSDSSPHSNTLSLSVPFDSIYGADKCNYELTPKVNPPAASRGNVAVGVNINVRGHIDTEGYDKGSHTWQLTAKVYQDNPPIDLNGTSETYTKPCDWKGGACLSLLSGVQGDGFGNGTFHRPAAGNYSYSTAGLEAGNWVCFVMSVKKPTWKFSSVDKWRHSSMKCVGITGDQTGTVVTSGGNNYSYYPKLSARSIVKNVKGYPKVDNYLNKNYVRDDYKWKLIEAKFDRMPNSISPKENGGCSVVENVSGYLNDSCEVINSGDNLFPTAGMGDPSPINGNSKGEGADPIGTWTCYTFSYLTNPRPLDDVKADIELYYSDWNDSDGESRRPSRWNDGYYIYEVIDKEAEYKDGVLITPQVSHYVTVGEPLPGDYVDTTFESFVKDSIPPAFQFTPYGPTSCSQSGIEPKVQIRSHDLKVIGGVDTSLTNMPVGNTMGNYGSTGEYGILSGGPNNLLASGSGLLRGSTSPSQADWSPLTFTNAGANPFGNYDVPSISQPVSSEVTELPDGTDLADTTYAKKQRIVYKVNGTLKITGDLKYPNEYARIGELPRVVYIAENVEIGPNVRQIDPWIIASGTINTCATPDSQTDGDEVKLHTGMCNRQLTFNGPVYAANILLYRTGGSRVQKSQLEQPHNKDWTNPDSDSGIDIDPNDYCEDGCGGGLTGRTAALSGPAEIFNLRPDAFLSSFSGRSTGVPVATTDKVTELPPRF